MTIAKDFVAKASVAVVAVAMILSLFAPAAKAQTTEELQKMINDLMAQIAALESGSTTTSSASVCPYTWTRDLKTGATGADVKMLQSFLNADADTRVAATGAGSTGMETETFGPATAAAVSKFQVKYRADILTPAGLVNPTAYFGPSTRAKANALCVTSTTPDEEDEDTDEDTEDVELSGEGSLDVLEIDDASDSDVEEGAEDVEIAQLTIEATDGDIEITRLDISLENDGSNSDDPWDVFETISLWVDGEMIADVAADDKDEYLDDNDGSLRFTGFSLVAMEDEEIEVTVAATIAGSVDNLSEDWTVTADAVRYFDADGVASDDSTTDDLGGPGDATVTVVAAGDGEELKFSLSSDNPDATDIVVDDNSTTDGVTVMEYTIEAQEGDITLNELWVNLTTGTENVGDVVDDISIEIDGQTIKDEATTTSATSVNFMFDVDGDVTIDADEEVVVKVIVDFKATDDGANYTNGETLTAKVTTNLADLTDAEGADDLVASQISGSATGETHTLVAEGIVVPADGVTTTADTTGDNDQTGEFTIEFEVTAVEGDFYISDVASESATSGVEFSVEVATGTTTASGVLSSSADEETTGVFTVRDGETETFTLTVTVDTSASAQVRVLLDEVNYTSDPNGVSFTTAYIPTPASDFRTGYKNVNAN